MGLGRPITIPNPSPSLHQIRPSLTLTMAKRRHGDCRPSNYRRHVATIFLLTKLLGEHDNQIVRTRHPGRPASCSASTEPPRHDRWRHLIRAQRFTSDDIPNPSCPHGLALLSQPPLRNSDVDALYHSIPTLIPFRPFASLFPAL